MSASNFRLLIGATALLACSSLASAQSAPENPVKLNQVGLLPDAAKRAMVAHPSKQPLPWRLLDASGRTQSSGRTRVFGSDAASGDHVHQVDFSGFRKAGSGYRLLVGAARSRPFAIGPRTYQRLPYDALNYFYQNRAGTPIEARFAGG